VQLVTRPEPWVVGEFTAGVEDALVVGDEDVDAVDVAAAGRDALGQLGDDAHGVGALEEVDAEEVAGGHGRGERPPHQGQHLPMSRSIFSTYLSFPDAQMDGWGVHRRAGRSRWR